jgi:hypothetical protein
MGYVSLVAIQATLFSGTSVVNVKIIAFHVLQETPAINVLNLSIFLTTHAYSLVQQLISQI